MKIGMISPYSLTLPGGVQDQILTLAHSLRNRGLSVRVLGPCDGPPPETEITPLGNSLPTASNGSIAPIAPDPAAALRTIRILRDENFDLIHLHEPLAPGPTMTSLLFKTAPTIGTFHAAGSSIPYKWLKPLVKKMASRLDVRCAVSDDAASLAHGHLGGEYKILFNAVDIDLYQSAKKINFKNPTIFFMGRHESRKGLKHLIKAMDFLPEEVCLKIAGDGPETEELKSMTESAGKSERVDWLGRLSLEDKISHLASADVFCAPSMGSESFGVVLLEAMAAKTPIVASNLEAYSKVARKDKDALLIEPGNSKALAEAVSEVLNKNSVSGSLVDSGFKRVQNFSIDNLALCYEEIYRQLLA